MSLQKLFVVWFEASSSAAISVDNASADRVSVTVTVVPNDRSNFAAAIPLRFMPKTVAHFPCNCTKAPNTRCETLPIEVSTYLRLPRPR